MTMNDMITVCVTHMVEQGMAEDEALTLLQEAFRGQHVCLYACIDESYEDISYVIIPK